MYCCEAEDSINSLCVPAMLLAAHVACCAAGCWGFRGCRESVITLLQAARPLAAKSSWTPPRPKHWLVEKQHDFEWSNGPKQHLASHELPCW